MATTALGIMQDSGGAGVSPLTHRKCIQARWNNTGIVYGLAVTGTSGLTYSVSAGVAVVSRSAADGYAEAYFEGGSTPAVSAGDPSNPRVDLVWIKANDIQQGDPDNRVHIGVTQGTPSSSPASPSCPSGCIEIARMMVPAGATSTSSATMDSDRSYAIPFGASMGLLGENVNTADLFGDATIHKWYYENSVSFYVPTDRLVELVFSCTFTNANADTQQAGSIDGSVGPISWGVAAFQIDGEDVPHSGTEWQASNGVWEDHQVTCIVEVTAGAHTARARTGLMAHREASGCPYFRYTEKDGIQYKGRVLRVWDRGVS